MYQNLLVENYVKKYSCFCNEKKINLSDSVYYCFLVLFRNVCFCGNNVYVFEFFSCW